MIFVAGIRLSKFGDIIAEMTGLGRTWIGVILVASVTSLPELITGVSSVVVFDLPEIAVGDILGSCMFNILVIAMLDLGPRSAPISSRAHQGLVLPAAFGILLLGVVALTIFAGTRLPVLGWLGMTSIVFVVVYFFSIRMIFSYEKRRKLELPRSEDEGSSAGYSRRRVYFLYALNAVFIIAAATWLPHLGDRISKITGLGNTFVGSLFVALSTSLPELVITIGAMRIGAVDLALGNLFGSNLFNIGILAVDDLLYVKGALLMNISGSHLVSALAAMMMSAVAVIGLTYRTNRKFLFLAWDSAGIVTIYLIAAWILFASR